MCSIKVAVGNAYNKTPVSRRALSRKMKVLTLSALLVTVAVTVASGKISTIKASKFAWPHILRIL